jgi:uncharacterized membrane protein
MPKTKKTGNAISKKPLSKDIRKLDEEIEDIGEDVDKIRESVTDSGKDVDEIKEDVGELKEDIDEIQKSQQNILKTLKKRFKDRMSPDKFAWDDLAQQIVGAMILSAPLAVTEEVWQLSHNLDLFRLVVMLFITLLFNVLLIYYTKYQIVGKEKIIGIIPTRLFSQILVSYTTAAIMLYILGVIGGQVTELFDIARLVIFVGLFANIGAGTADLLK